MFILQLTCVVSSLSPLTWVQITLRRCVPNTTLCDKVCQWLAAGQWFSAGTLVPSPNITDHHDISDILLKVALNIMTLTLYIPQRNLVISLYGPPIAGFREVALYLLNVVKTKWCNYILNIFDLQYVDVPWTK
jgi:hypothetical protein